MDNEYFMIDYPGHYLVVRKLTEYLYTVGFKVVKYATFSDALATCYQNPKTIIIEP